MAVAASLLTDKNQHQGQDQKAPTVQAKLSSNQVPIERCFHRTSVCRSSNSLSQPPWEASSLLTDSDGVHKNQHQGQDQKAPTVQAKLSSNQVPVKRASTATSVCCS